MYFYCVCFFIRTDLEKFSITSLAHKCLVQWMGAVRTRVQTADKKHHNDPQAIRILATSDGLVKRLKLWICFFFLQTWLLISQDVNWWPGVVWIILKFLSAVWTFIPTAPIHSRGSINEKLMWISSNLFRLRNKLIYIFDGLICSKCSFVGELFF